MIKSHSYSKKTTTGHGSGKSNNICMYMEGENGAWTLFKLYPFTGSGSYRKLLVNTQGLYQEISTLGWLDLERADC